MNCDGIAKNYKKSGGETNKEYLQRIKRDFLNKIFQERHYYKKIEVKFDKNQITVDGKKEVTAFFHVTSSDKNKNKRREVDIERYQKCMLVFAILDNCKSITCTSINVTVDPNYSDRLRIYCSKFRYTIVMKKKNSKYEFITAFPVSKNNEHKF